MGDVVADNADVAAQTTTAIEFGSVRQLITMSSSTSYPYVGNKSPTQYIPGRAEAGRKEGRDLRPGFGLRCASRLFAHAPGEHPTQGLLVPS